MNKERILDASTTLEVGKDANATGMALATLKSLEAHYGECQNGVDKLGVVLEELVKMLDLDGSGIDIYLLQYVADARQTLRSIVQLIDTGCSAIE